MAELMTRYMQQIGKYAPLSFEDEQALAHRWKDEKDERAFETLMNSYLRLVVKVAMSFRGYGLPVEEMIQEGNIGLMQAIHRFEPERGFRLSTYAMWWIKAQIQEYILNNWSLVKIGTSSTQKKLFFNLRRLRNEMLGEDEVHLNPDAIKAIAKELSVSEGDVVGMDQRIRSGGDHSLNVTYGDDDSGSEAMDFMVEERPNQEAAYAANQQTIRLRGKLKEALDILDDRERQIFVARYLQEPEQTPTLEALSQHFGVSRERVRQLEARAYQKVQKFIGTDRSLLLH